MGEKISSLEAKRFIGKCRFYLQTTTGYKIKSKLQFLTAAAR